jgi:hypothetical protein
MSAVSLASALPDEKRCEERIRLVTTGDYTTRVHPSQLLGWLHRQLSSQAQPEHQENGQYDTDQTGTLQLSSGWQRTWLICPRN